MGTITTALLLTLLTAATAATAHAEAPAAGFRLGLGVNSGLMLNNQDARARGIVNPQQLGFQANIGASLRCGLYLGATARAFLGVRSFGDHARAQQLSLDLGYAIGAHEHLSVRPMLELGVARYHVNAGVIDEDNDIGAFVAPGLDLIADVSDHFWLGGLARVGFAFMGDGADDIAFSDNDIDISLTLGGLAGVRF